MAITTVLFDLDGTLLPMDQDLFTKKYFGALAAKLAPHGYDPEQLIKGVWAGTAAMVKNTGGKTNEEAFWEDFTGRFGRQVRDDIPIFDEFYRTDFSCAKEACGFAPMAAQIVARLKERGFRVILATNPIFPAIATQNRIRWAGLEPEDFELYTTYENSCHCKPNLDYYRDILAQLNVTPEECLMVGNDVREDMVAEMLGMQVFLLTDCLLNKDGTDISDYPQGGFPELAEYLENLK